MGRLGSRARLGSVRTKILFDDSGILEVYHLDRPAILTGVGLLGGEVAKQVASCDTICRTVSI